MLIRINERCELDALERACFLGMQGCTFFESALFWRTFSKNGELIGPDSVFALSDDRVVIATKLTAPVPLPSETLYVLIRDHEKTVERFYMKRSEKTPLLAYALIEVKTPAIYRVFVYDPSNRRFPIARFMFS